MELQMVCWRSKLPLRFRPATGILQAPGSDMLQAPGPGHEDPEESELPRRVVRLKPDGVQG